MYIRISTSLSISILSMSFSLKLPNVRALKGKEVRYVRMSCDVKCTACYDDILILNTNDYVLANNLCTCLSS